MDGKRSAVMEVENLAKSYMIRHESKGAFQYVALRDVLTNMAGAVTGPFLRLLGLGKGTGGERAELEEVWALDALSFSIARGECVGIIGRNGAGKSTLLKLLSRITAPTKGKIRVRGQVTSLLEVGTGFHPELTGRENIFLNGAVMGMRRKEIQQKFDEIVAFAEVDRFLDTPVKRYSSGMYVRLAFAVAAHLEPDILLVDEVLSVGDALFQRKSLGKMEETTRSGRTVLFVSHNMPMVASLCSRCILLDGGRLQADGDTQSTIDAYYQGNAGSGNSVGWDGGEKGPGDEVVRLKRASILDEEGHSVSELPIDKAFVIELEYEVFEETPCLTPNLHFTDSRGVVAFVSLAGASHEKEKRQKAGVYLSRCTVPGDLLNDQVYYVGVAMTEMERVKVRFYERDLLYLRVYDPMEGIRSRGDFRGSIPGSVRPALHWERERRS